MVDGTMNAAATETLDTSRLYLLACLPIPRQEMLLSHHCELTCAEDSERGKGDFVSSVTFARRSLQ